MEALLIDSEISPVSTSAIFKNSDDQFVPFWTISRNYIARNSTVFPDINSFSREITDFIQKLNDFASLKDNWDSYSAEAPSKISVKNARQFLLNNAQVALPFYFVSPGVNGEVIIELKNENKAAEIYFLPDASSELVMFDGVDCIFEGSLNEAFSTLIRFFND
jgi:hypothetical protein